MDHQDQKEKKENWDCKELLELEVSQDLKDQKETLVLQDSLETQANKGLEVWKETQVNLVTMENKEILEFLVILDQGVTQVFKVPQEKWYVLMNFRIYNVLIGTLRQSYFPTLLGLYTSQSEVGSQECVMLYNWTATPLSTRGLFTAIKTFQMRY